MPSTPCHAGRAFTLVELLIVVVVLAILVGLLVPTVQMLRRSQFRTVTIETMENLTRAITLYVDTYASLGVADDAADFVAAPLTFLYQNRIDVGLKPYFEPAPAQRVLVLDPPAARVRLVGTPAPGGAVTVATENWRDAPPAEATHFTDGYGRNVLIWRVLNAVTGNRHYPRLIEIRSQAGTAADPSDDLIYIQVLGDQPVAFDGLTYPGTDGNWLLVKQQDL